MDSGDFAVEKPRPAALHAEEFSIYDNFLPAEEFGELAAYANDCNYHEVHEKGVRKVWRLHDGTPLQGETTYLPATPNPVAAGPRRVEAPPTGSWLG